MTGIVDCTCDHLPAGSPHDPKCPAYVYTAVAAERERCAKLCDDMADRHVVTEVSKRDALREAATDIRKGR